MQKQQGQAYQRDHTQVNTHQGLNVDKTADKGDRERDRGEEKE